MSAFITMSKRPHISLKVKLAAALLQIRKWDWSETKPYKSISIPVISYEEAKSMTTDGIIARFHFDHYPIRHADGGPSEPWNLVPRLIQEHRTKTAKIDIPEIAKGKRIRKKAARHKEKIDLKIINLGATGFMPPFRSWGLASRGFDKTKTKTFSGKVVARKKR
jgi:hypothetical protein